MCCSRKHTKTRKKRLYGRKGPAQGEREKVGDVAKVLRRILENGDACARKMKRTGLKGRGVLFGVR